MKHYFDLKTFMKERGYEDEKQCPAWAFECDGKEVINGIVSGTFYGSHPNWEICDQNETIIRCANELAKALLDAGYCLEETSGTSGFSVSFYSHLDGYISVSNIISGWEVEGKTPLEITFKQEEENKQALEE